MRSPPPDRGDQTGRKLDRECAEVRVYNEHGKGDSLTPGVSNIPPQCKICASRSIYFDTADSNKSCNIQKNPCEKSGVLVTYYRCEECGFIFTNHFDNFSKDDFILNIYNHDYKTHDPLYDGIRPKKNADFFRKLLPYLSVGKNIKILDYGSGSGLFSKFLKDDLSVDNYDPMTGTSDVVADEVYDVIFSSEVVEHAPFPRMIAQDWARLLNRDGVVLFSTQIQPDDIEHIRASWWYIGPRNGHTSIFSHESLKRLLEDVGLLYKPLSSEWHIGYSEDRAGSLDEAKLAAFASDVSTGFVHVESEEHL